ncbi:MAG: hypothetical protein ACREDF_11315 [Thermoplasmata archaeon]
MRSVAPSLSRSEILKEALRSRHNEAFEKALSRAVRKLGGSFAEYVAIIAEVRDYGRVHKMDLRDAARSLAHQA